MAQEAGSEAGSEAGVVIDPQAVKAEYRIDIDASPDKVWAILSDFAGWANWNPIYAPPVCVPKVGEAISSAVTMPGGSPNRFTAEISVWEPNARFHWYSSVMDGQMTMTRYMVIEKTGDQSCTFTNGEAFGGAMGPTIMKDLVGGIETGFQAMSQELKKAAEAL